MVLCISKMTAEWFTDNEPDLNAFETYYRNDDNGRPAYDPRVLLKITLLAYSKGITSSRKIDGCAVKTSSSWRCWRICNYLYAVNTESGEIDKKQ